MRQGRLLAGFLPLGLTLLSLPAHAARWNVHADGTGDAPTIQAAIDLAVSGDSVVLAPGTFQGPGNRNISYHGKGLVVMSAAGRDVTIIDCQGAGRGFIFNTNEPYSARLEDVTITNGFAIQGGGIFLSGLTHVTVHRCLITQCQADRGGGVYCGDMSAGFVTGNTITGNTAIDGGGVSDDQFCYTRVQFNNITGNTASQYGGGIYSGNDTGESYFEDNTIEGNSAASGGGIAILGHFAAVSRNRILSNTGSGAGVFAAYGGSLDGNLIAGNAGIGLHVGLRAAVERCTIVGNGSHGVVVAGNARLALGHSIIAFNVGSGVVCTLPSATTIDCCDVFGNVGGSCYASEVDLFSQDPLFCATSGDSAYYLASNSPCAPLNSPCEEQIGAYPVGCEEIPIPPLAAYIHCPPDTTVPQGTSYTLVTLKPFTIVNDGEEPVAFEYDVTSPGPAVLLDGGNPAALAGTTPLLNPGDTYLPPPAQLLAGDSAPFSQVVTFHVHSNSPTVDTDCSTSVMFQRPVAAMFSAVRAELAGRSVRLAWTLHSDESMSEILVRRAPVAGHAAAPSVIARLEPTVTSYVDDSARPGETVDYDLVVMSGDDVVVASAPVRVRMPALSLAVTSISPNPFRTSTRIAFDVPADAPVAMDVFDVGGRRVQTLLHRGMPAGSHEITWSAGDGTPLASGVYFVRLSQGKSTAVRKVTVVE